MRPVLTHASLGWFPFVCNTATNHLEFLNRAACRVITGCLSSTPSSLLLPEAQLPPLNLTLEHQALSSFKRAPLFSRTCSSFERALSPPFLVPMVLECMSHAPNARHPISCPFPLVQLPPALQLKPLPSSKVSIGVLAI